MYRCSFTAAFLLSCTSFILLGSTAAQYVQECTHGNDYCHRPGACSRVFTTLVGESGECQSMSRVLTNVDDTVKRFEELNDQLGGQQRRLDTIEEQEDSVLLSISQLNEERKAHRQAIHHLARRVDELQSENAYLNFLGRFHVLQYRIVNQTNVCSGSEWHYFRKKCYYLGGQTTPYTWNEARLFCERLGGQLVVINDGETTEFLNELIGETESKVWIGLSDTDIEEQWKWIDGIRMNYTNWEPGQPNNLGSGEDCACLKSGRWYDHDCSSFHRYICERQND